MNGQTPEQVKAHADAIQTLAQLGVPTFLNAREKGFEAACQLYQKVGADGFKALFDKFAADVATCVEPVMLPSGNTTPPET